MKNLEDEAPGKRFEGARRRKTVKLVEEELIATEFLPQAERLPLVVKPALEGLDLITWAERNQEYIKESLLNHGGILFRDFNLRTASDLERFINTTSSGQMLEYRDRSSPRTVVKDKIYTSTEYPADQSIFPHNEGTYWLTWPLKIYFFCERPAEQGGETPIASTRNIYTRVDPRIREKFMEKNVLYIRNYNDGFGLTWQTVFQTEERSVVERYCRANKIEFEWKDDDRLRTRQYRQAVASHPDTGSLVWFNHATFFHVSTLEPTIRDALLAEFKEEDLPFNTYYGDGSPIEPSVLEELRHLYREELIYFAWQKGDVLMLDNMLTAHGRASYVGSRRILAGMADPFTPMTTA